jgi:hypothetical protein
VPTIVGSHHTHTPSMDVGESIFLGNATKGMRHESDIVLTPTLTKIKHGTNQVIPSICEGYAAVNLSLLMLLYFLF